jgi:hypothetical protein
MDAVERKIASTGAQLDTVAKALDGWQANTKKERLCVERLKTCVPSFLDESNCEVYHRLGSYMKNWRN